MNAGIRRLAMGCCIVLLACSFCDRATAEDKDQPEVSLGAVRTDLEATGVRLAMEYFENLQVIWEADRNKADPRKGSLTDAKPEVDIQTGSKDSFGGVVAKLTGYHIRFKVRDLNGVPVVDVERLWHVIPFSAGIEANRNFDRVNGIVEVGYIPFKLKEKGIYKLGLNPRVGAYLQGGYKFSGDSGTIVPSSGGARDESEEEVDHWIARLKVDARLTMPILGKNSKGGKGLSVIWYAAGWRDFANDEWYYRATVTARVAYLEGKMVDLKYEKGSGAPNFNQGDQFSANLTVAF